MHPILTGLRQLGLYLLAWAPLSAILVYLMVRRGELRWTEAAILIVPLCLVYAFLCLTAWYPCRATPLDQSGFLKLVFTHLTAAVLLASLWVQAAKMLADGLARWTPYVELGRRTETFLPLLWVTGILLYVLSVTFNYVVLAERSAREAQSRALEALVLARDAELKALRAQVNPHFLFNCLNSISALTSADSARAREMCILLADFLRTTLRLGGKEIITLQEELDLVRGYLAIEKVRFGARVRMEEEVQEEALPVLVPPLLLQPLVENAIRHGIANLPQGGTIELRVQRTPQEVSISVENTFDPDTPSKLKTGLGLENIRQRLHTRYGSEAHIVVRSDDDRFSVRVQLPAENGAGA